MTTLLCIQTKDVRMKYVALMNNTTITIRGKFAFSHHFCTVQVDLKETHRKLGISTGCHSHEAKMRHCCTGKTKSQRSRGEREKLTVAYASGEADAEGAYHLLDVEGAADATRVSHVRIFCKKRSDG